MVIVKSYLKYVWCWINTKCHVKMNKYDLIDEISRDSLKTTYFFCTTTKASEAKFVFNCVHVVIHAFSSHRISMNYDFPNKLRLLWRASSNWPTVLPRTKQYKSEHTRAQNSKQARWECEKQTKLRDFHQDSIVYSIWKLQALATYVCIKSTAFNENIKSEFHELIM